MDDIFSDRLAGEFDGNSKRRKISNERFYNNEEFSDVEISFGSETIAAHRVVLSRKCEWFHKALSRDFKEGVTREIDFPEDDEQSVRALLYYCYDKEYDDAFDGKGDKFIFYLNVHVLATIYMVDQLQARSLQAIANTLSMRSWSIEDFKLIIDVGYQLNSIDSTQVDRKIEEFCLRHRNDIIKSAEAREVLSGNPKLNDRLWASLDLNPISSYAYRCKCRKLVFTKAHFDRNRMGSTSFIPECCGELITCSNLSSRMFRIHT